MTKSAKKIPAYLTKIYKNLYLNSYLYNFLDNGIIQNILTLGYHNTLTDELKKEADYITESVFDNGFVKAMEKFCFSKS
jgi:hypothetical protein